MFIRNARRTRDVKGTEEVLEVTMEGAWDPAGRTRYKVLTSRPPQSVRAKGWSILILVPSSSIHVPLAVWEGCLMSWVEPEAMLRRHGLDRIKEIDNEFFLHAEARPASVAEKKQEILEIAMEGTWKRQAGYKVLTSRHPWYDMLLGTSIASWSILVLLSDKGHIPLAVWEDTRIRWINPRADKFGSLDLVSRVNKKFR